MGYLSYRNALLANRNYFQRPVDLANANVTAFNEKLNQEQDVANSSWLRHPIAKATQDVKGFFGLGDVLPDVPNAPKEYRDLRNEQLKQNEGKGLGTRMENLGNQIGTGITNEYQAEKDLSIGQRYDRRLGLGLEQTKKVAKGAEQFLSGFVDVGKDIYQGSVYAGQSGEQVNKINSLISQMNTEKDPEKLKQLNETLKQETQKLNDIPVPEMMNQTNAQLIAKAGLATFNTMLTAVTLGTGNLLAKGGEKVGGNFLEKILASTMEKAPLELGADATFKQIITSDLARVAQNKITRAVVKVIGNKATAESTAIGGAYMAADAVKNGETDPKKILDATEKGMAFGWILDRTMTSLVKVGSKLIGQDTQRLSLQELISATEARSGRPLTDAEKEIAIKAFKTRTGTPQSVAAGLEKPTEGFVETPPQVNELAPKTAPEAIKPEIGATVPETPTAPSNIVSQPLQEGVNPLIQEAKKGEVLYHGGSKIDTVKTGKSNFSGTFYMSDDPNYAKSFGGKNSVVNKMELSPSANLADMRKPSEELISQIDELAKGKQTGKTFKIKKPDGSFVEVPEIKGDVSFHPYNREQVIQGLRDGKAHFAELPEVKKILKKLGYDGQITSEVPYAKNVGVWNKDVVKVSQPLQEGGIVKGTTEVQPTIGETGVPKTETLGRTAKAALDINRKIVQQGFDALPDEELAKYGPWVKDEQIEKVATILGDYENAKKIAITGEGVPAGVKKQILFNAVENKASQEGDVELLRQLAKSPIASELSAHASELGSAAVMHNQNSPVSAMQEVVKAREKYATKKVGDITKATKKIATEINNEVKNIPHSKSAWTDFVSSITCK